MRRGRPPHPDVLTPREQEVIALIREGLTNEQIAQRLGITESGARYHVSQILSKLGVSSRAEAAAWPKERSPGALGIFMARVRAAAGVAGPRLALVAVVSGVALVAAITLGVAIMTSRGGAQQPNAQADATPPGPELQDFLAVAAQAEAVAKAQMSGAQLYTAFVRPNDIFTFHYTNTARDLDVAIDGPHVNDPSMPLWRVASVRIGPDQVSGLDDLDLAKLQNAPALVLAAAQPDLEGLAAPFGACTDHQLIAAVGSQNGELRWTVNLGCGRFVGSTTPPVFTCEMPDADLAQRLCQKSAGGQPWSPPAWSGCATPDVVPSPQTCPP